MLRVRRGSRRIRRCLPAGMRASAFRPDRSAATRMRVRGSAGDSGYGQPAAEQAGRTGAGCSSTTPGPAQRRWRSSNSCSGRRRPGLECAGTRLRPMVHHWWTAERLADHVARLARRNSALEDPLPTPRWASDSDGRQCDHQRGTVLGDILHRAPFLIPQYRAEIVAVPRSRE